MTAITSSARPLAPARPWLLRPPGVYRPQDDTWFLATALRASGMAPGAKVLDLCTGTGALALTAAAGGAGAVTAVDISRRALAAVWANARLRRLPVRPVRGSLAEAARRGPYDVVLANPPYVPCPIPASGAARAWDAGPDGRVVLSPVCSEAPSLVAPGGYLLLVHSTVAGVDQSLDELRAAGMTAAVVASRFIPFGPVMRKRAEFLEAAGLITAGQRLEELVVIRADRP
ncbi:methyltransferase [Amycolatopsis regifaucium]|uniref:Methyltransferase n=1 Tax=Amycolatopsis regifaucium TaxID=546365 RepID=A0ABX3DRW8_9PSEU|nr:methyltransferase [Amycolatopsis regifaucium]OKA07506.1 methyltransferase [Amycolatopsis regifaucium]SFH09816.1 release factor glutamine methyltransferase [Amycolatopsis regifaucium]